MSPVKSGVVTVWVFLRLKLPLIRNWLIRTFYGKKKILGRDVRVECNMFGLLCVHQKRDNISPSFFVNSMQGSSPLSLILLPILSVPYCILL